MCVIAVSPKGQKFPTINQIQNCVNGNPDGFAMSWNEDGKVRTYKTMSDTAIIKYYKKFIKTHDPLKTALVFHARIATHGSKNIKNCHCWQSDGLSFAHNGILSVANRGDMTDSETFFQDIFLPIYRSSGWDGATKAINACIGSSKFAFIDGTGRVWGFGNYKTKDGNYFSNDSYMSYEERYPYYYASKSAIKGGSEDSEVVHYSKDWWKKYYPSLYDEADCDEYDY